VDRDLLTNEDFLRAMEDLRERLPLGMHFENLLCEFLAMKGYRPPAPFRPRQTCCYQCSAPAHYTVSGSVPLCYPCYVQLAPLGGGRLIRDGTYPLSMKPFLGALT